MVEKVENEPAVENPPPRAPRAPSPRLTAALAALMLAIGVALGAAIGPAPTASLGQGLPLDTLLPRLLAAAVANRQTASSAPTAPLAQTAGTPKRKRKRRHAHRAASVQSETLTAASPASSTETSTSTSPSKTPSTAPTPKKVVLPPVTHVWLIELSGSTFEGALASPTGAPYITGQAIPAGALLASWSALDAGAFANDAALLASTPPQLLETIVEPPCPEGAAGAQCLTGTPGALTAADEFLKQTIPTITATAAYRESGLIVITFGSIASGAAAGLPSGSTTPTLTAQPPAGALLISPFVTAASRPTTAFNPSSPTQSLEKVLHK